MKTLSEILEAVEPKLIDHKVGDIVKIDDKFFGEANTEMVDRASYDRMKSVAIELAKALVDAERNIGDMCIYPEKRKWEYEKKAKQAARDALTRARSLLEGGK
jgi:hypothetical protein